MHIIGLYLLGGVGGDPQLRTEVGQAWKNF